MQKDNTPRPITIQDLTPKFLLRFWKKVDKRADCWIWTGSTDRQGYGMIVLGGKRTLKAHRAMWVIYNGDLKREIQVLHDCPSGDNPSCVNPNHLWIGDNNDNMNDKMKKGRFVPFPDHHGESHPRAKLTESDVRQIRLLYSTTKTTLKALAAKFGISFQQVSSVIRRRTWNCVP